MTGKLWLCKVVGRAEPDPSIETRKPYILQPLGEVILDGVEPNEMANLQTQLESPPPGETSGALPAVAKGKGLA